MVEFIVTVPAGTGGGYYIDGVQKPIVPVVTGGTFRFNQNAANNNNHPLILSTTASTAGIISTGVSYYLDGPSNSTDYRNTVLFNAATVRYIEITVAQTVDFYYLCQVHGGGMGNVMDITINTWSALNWNSGLWGKQNDITVLITSVVDSPIAWNAGNFGSPSSFGGVYDDIGISLGDETTAGEINEGWGRLTWGENAWGGTGDVILSGNQINLSTGTVTFKIDSLPSVTGLQLNTSINDVYAFGLAVVNPTGQQLNISEGIADPAPDALVTGQQLNISSIGNVTVTTEINSGWGRLTWGQNDWDTDGISIITIPTGQQLNISQGDETITIDVSPVITGNTLNISEGEVDPSPDANVTGIGMTVALSVGTVVIGTANVGVTGQQINITQGTAIGTPNTLVSVTGIGLNIAVGTVFAGGTSIIIPTGNGLTIALNSINNQIWTEINTGTDATWIEIDTAA